MKSGCKKLTQEEIQEMMKLYMAGVSTNKIGEMKHRDHTTVLYWVDKFGLPRRGRDWSPTQGQEGIITQIKDEDQLKEERRTSFCLGCQKEKDPRWARTQWCGVKCWDTQIPEKQFNYFGTKKYERV